MSDHPSYAHTPSRQAIASLIAGLASLVMFVIFLVFTWGATPLIIATVLGAIAIILGIIALRHHQAKGLATTGITAGAISFLLGAAIFIFALVFVGAIAL